MFTYIYRLLGKIRNCVRWTHILENNASLTVLMRIGRRTQRSRVMDCLDLLEAEQRDKQLLKLLQTKKQKLIQELETLKHQTYPIETIHNEMDTVEYRDCLTLTDICDSYRVLGISLQSTGAELVLRFDPVYGSDLPASESYSVQLLRRGTNFLLGQHNIPVWVPASTLEKYLAEGIQSFVYSVRDVLYAFTQRRAALLKAQDEYRKHLVTDIQVDLPVTFVNLHLGLLDESSMDIKLQYKLLECRPHIVDVEIDADDSSMVNNQKHQKTVDLWKKCLSTMDLHAALGTLLET